LINPLQRPTQTDVAFVVGVGSIPLWMQAPQFFTHNMAWAAVLCSCFAPLYRGRFRRYFLAALCGFLASYVVITIFLWGGEELWPLPLFAIVYLRAIFVGAVIAALIFVAYDALCSRLVTRHAIRVGVWWVIVAAAAGWIGIGIGRDVSNDDKALTEVNKRSALLAFIRNTVESSRGDLSGPLAGAKQQARTIYGADSASGVPVHGYGGPLTVSADGRVIAVEYAGIPAGQPCYWMYFMNRSDAFHSTVNGISTESPLNSAALEQTRQRLCFSSDLPVSVRFVLDADNLSR